MIALVVTVLLTLSVASAVRQVVRRPTRTHEPKLLKLEMKLLEAPKLASGLIEATPPTAARLRELSFMLKRSATEYAELKRTDYAEFADKSRP